MAVSLSCKITEPDWRHILLTDKRDIDYVFDQEGKIYHPDDKDKSATIPNYNLTENQQMFKTFFGIPQLTEILE